MTSAGYTNDIAPAPTRMPGSGVASAPQPRVDSMSPDELDESATLSPDEVENLKTLTLQGGDVGIRAADVLRKFNIDVTKAVLQGFSLAKAGS